MQTVTVEVPAGSAVTLVAVEDRPAKVLLSNKGAGRVLFSTEASLEDTEAGVILEPETTIPVTTSKPLYGFADELAEVLVTYLPDHTTVE